MGHLKELIKGRDNKTRGAVLTVVGNKRRLTELRRPVQHLVPVECRESVKCMSQTEKKTEETFSFRTKARALPRVKSEHY